MSFSTSSDLALRVRDVGKEYVIGRTSSESLRELVVGRMKDPLGRRKVRDTFWALKDVSFDVKRGEVVGLIGRNGAGKSTLLKILSRITEPTTGEIDLWGRVGSLLEVGTGFHPELTGRENVYLNGGILGMSRKEIDSRFDEIVDFSGVERFLDTPVKRYSSGMFVRLAFAVAAHLEPEVLIVDEVLAVGDVAFQNKCLEKMKSVGEQGRTVLVVSHNTAVMNALTSRCVWLEAGQVVADGPTADLVRRYASEMGEEIPLGSVDLSLKKPGRALRSVDVLHGDETASGVPMGEPLCFRVTIDSEQPIHRPQIGIGLQSGLDTRVVSLSTFYHPEASDAGRGMTRGIIECRPKDLRLNQGRYTLTVTLSDGTHDHVVDRAENAVAFEIVPRDVFGTGEVPGKAQGFIYCDSEWHFDHEREPALLGAGGASA